MNFIIKNRFYHFIAILPCIASVFLFSACEETMDVSFSGDSTRNLVVEGTITTDTMAHKVRLSYTSDYFQQSKVQMATGATVSITDGNTIFTLHEDEAGIYYTHDSVYGEVGKSYTLLVHFEDGREYDAVDYMNPCVQFDSITQTANFNSYMTGYGYDVMFYGLEPEPIGNYYLFLLYKNNILVTDTITEAVFSDDEFINGMYVNEFPVYRINEVDLLEDSALYTLEMHSVNRKYYEFMNALMTETIWKGSPWDGPPANIPGNISNGGKGYFRASDVKRRSNYFYPTPRMN